METPYSSIAEIKEAQTSDEANGLLKRGFVLVKAIEKRTVDKAGNQLTDIVYVLGRPRTNGESQSTASERNAQSDGSTNSIFDESVILAKLPWKKFRTGGGEWTFLTGPDDALVPELEPAREFTEKVKSGEEVTVGAYRYRVREKFLKRFPAENPAE